MHGLMHKVDNEMDKNNLIAELRGADEALANALAAEEDMQSQKLKQRRELLKKRRKNK
jgi:hypothetical protein